MQPYTLTGNFRFEAFVSIQCPHDKLSRIAGRPFIGRVILNPTTSRLGKRSLGEITLGLANLFLHNRFGVSTTSDG